MKTKFIVLLILLAVSSFANAQSATIKVMLEQIAALQVYIGHVKDTYRIAKNGLDFIGDKTGAERDLHRQYFLSLRTINPKVSGYKRVQDCLDTYIKISQNQDKYLSLIRNAEFITDNEKRYLTEVYHKISRQADLLIDNLEAVLQSGQLEMEDNERLEAIDQTYHDISELSAFSQSFGNEAMRLNLARSRQKSDIVNLRNFN